MKILLINQPTSNHGDEAAGKALIRALRDQEKNQEISILYNSKIHYDYEYFDIDSNMKHFKCKDITMRDKILLILTFVFPFFLIKRFFRFGDALRYEYDLIKQNDRIISSPGGVNIGPYKDWRYIWRLFVSLKLKKMVAIYSISFGPIPDNRLFRKISIYILKNVYFLSLRDKKSQKFADELSIKYVSSIDTAFLNNQPKVSVPEEIKKQLLEEYVIVVPNQLYKWHPVYKDVQADKLDDIYIKIIDYFVQQKIKVLLLPQMFGTENDSKYFDLLKNKIENNKDIIIISDEYSSDIQQEIIKNANFLVGARYHTIIFSINNDKPFLSLAYEHKMTNTLEILGLEKSNIDINTLINNKDNDVIDLLDKHYTNRDKLVNDVLKARNKAHHISKMTFYLLTEQYLQSSHKQDDTF